MMKMKYNWIVICLMVVFLIGCGSNVSDKAGQYNFKQGVIDLKVDLFDNAPPDKIYPGSNFKVIVELDNKIAYDLRDVLVKIIGLDQSHFVVFPHQQVYDLVMGRGTTNPSGEKHFADFSGTAFTLFENEKRYIGKYFIQVNYNSEIDFVDTVCINPSLYEVYDSGCKVEPQKSFSGQGAPLAVEKMDTVISPGSTSEAEFRFHLKNKGKGKVTSIRFEKAQLGGKDITCTFRNAAANDPNRVFLSKKKQEAVLICRKPFLETLYSYETIVSVKFSYDYELKERKQLVMVE